MKKESELLSFYNSDLKIQLDPLEEFRVEHVKKAMKYLYFSIPFCVLFAISIYTEVPFLIFSTGLIAFIFILSAGQIVNNMRQQLVIKFKCNILPELLRYLFDDVEYIPRQRIAKSVLEKSMLLPDRMMIVEGEDFMRFKIGDTRIMFCETTVLSSGGACVI